MTEQFSVILNLFQDLITQKLEGRQLKPTKGRKSEGQANLEGRKIRGYEGKLFSVNSLSSNPPTLLPSTNHSGGNAMLIPPYGLPCNDGTNIPSLEGSANEQRAKQRREGGGVRVPLYASEQDRGSKGEGESKPSPQPSPIGEGAICHSEGGQEVRRSSNLDGKKLRRYEGKLFTLKSLSSNPPTLLSSNNQPLPLSRKGRGKSTSPFNLHSSLKQRAAFTLADGDTHVAHFDNVRKAAFTLAEVLITLGIIGIVAALTMPALIGSYRKSVTEAKLKKFYSIMNQAVKLAEVENGEASMWMPQRGDDFGDFGEWYNKYLDKNINSLSKNYSGHYYHVAFADGSGFAAYIPTESMLLESISAYIFYCTDYKYCSMPQYDSGDDVAFSETNSFDGKYTFLFSICSNGKVAASSLCNPTHSYTRDKLLSGCSATDPHKRHFCTALIQHDGWKISKDYPWIK